MKITELRNPPQLMTVCHNTYSLVRLGSSLRHCGSAPNRPALLSRLLQQTMCQVNRHTEGPRCSYRLCSLARLHHSAGIVPENMFACMNLRATMAQHMVTRSGQPT